MTTYVLVHGAWAGAHTFSSVRPLLHAAGHQVFTPSLTGIGERSHLASPQVTLTTHIADVVNMVLFEDLNDIVLLGFSYGGAVVTGTLDHIADRVAHLVYLDAFVPNNGESIDSIRGAMPVGHGPELVTVGSEWLIAPRIRTYEDPAVEAWATPRRSSQPAKTFSEPVHLAQPLEDFPFTLTYIKALGDPRIDGQTNPFYDAADRAKASARWRYRETTSNHMIPNNRPGELAEWLLELA